VMSNISNISSVISVIYGANQTSAASQTSAVSRNFASQSPRKVAHTFC
jgi:hypothetical protein